jgi:hypothetical protein
LIYSALMRKLDTTFHFRFSLLGGDLYAGGRAISIENCRPCGLTHSYGSYGSKQNHWASRLENSAANNIGMMGHTAYGSLENRPGYHETIA